MGPFSFILLYISTVSAAQAAGSGGGNYSTQLMADLTPRGFTIEQWNAAVDTMIGKTQAYILSDLIENLAIRLKKTDEQVRNQINSDRASLGLKPMPPHQGRPGTFDFLKEYQESQEALQEESFSHLPSTLLSSITEQLHSHAASAASLPRGVRAYKRSIAPLVQVVSLQGYEEFGFVLFRTWYGNQSAWEEMLSSVDEFLDAQMEDAWLGEASGLEMIKDLGTIVLVEDEGRMDGIGQGDCAEIFPALRSEDSISAGLDIPIFLMADKDAILSFTTPDTDPFLYAVDATFSHASIAHPTDSSSQTAGSQDVNATDDSENEESYPGIFKVHPSALYHDLYVAMGSHMVAPVEIWESMRARKRVEKGGEGKSETKGHDEL